MVCASGDGVWCVLVVMVCECVLVVMVCVCASGDGVGMCDRLER